MLENNCLYEKNKTFKPRKNKKKDFVKLNGV